MSDRIIRIDLKGKCTVYDSVEFQFGSVTNQWAVANLKKLSKIATCFDGSTASYQTLMNEQILCEKL